ncbi:MULTISPECIES: (d)CMP kinase [Methanobacterium]|jgi:cytidylate kinase|uniref:Cytidylate kinase n=1 Tax=Methanobacterium bryantii TaxID=2161 RepID=A0A2A2H250_METBR|nr:MULTISPECIES: AAA family ATPase [Methanobacterium]OEC88046.1 cytidylate kinase [Methanobacterium sp. A39]PAV03447.1 cytidylate kinase [Methanobacterium bryantii]
MIITISGLAGSGTTTASKILSKKLDIPYVSAGDIFRQMAAEKNMDLLEFGKFAEENDDIDILIDKRQAEMANKSKNLIVEGRLSAHFVEADLKVGFIAPIDDRTKRICKRENKPYEVVKEEIISRSNSEAKRYHEIHGIDINDMEIYDLIINTGNFNALSIADIILKVVEVISCQQ